MPDSTCDDVGRSARSRPVAYLRFVAVLVLLATVVAGGAGLLGVRASTVSESADGYELELTYARVARSGLDVPFTLTVRRSGGFPEPVVVAIDRDYFGILEFRGRLPEPASETGDDERLHMTFDPPPGDALTVDFDVRAGAGSQWGESGSVAVVAGEREVVAVQFETWLVP